MFALTILILVFLESWEESHTGRSVLKACLVAQLDIFISSSICASQVYELDHIFKGLVLDHDRLVGFGVKPHDLGLPNVNPEAICLLWSCNLVVLR